MFDLLIKFCFSPLNELCLHAHLNSVQFNVNCNKIKNKINYCKKCLKNTVNLHLKLICNTIPCYSQLVAHIVVVVGRRRRRGSCHSRLCKLRAASLNCNPPKFQTNKWNSLRNHTKQGLHFKNSENMKVESSTHM